MPISTLETRLRISSFQSHASRRDWQFLSFCLLLRDENENFSYNLMFRDEIENSWLHSRASRWDREFRSRTRMRIFLTISCFETRLRISGFTLMLRDENENNSKSHVSNWYEKYFLEVEREKMNLILTWIPGIENSRYTLPSRACC